MTHAKDTKSAPGRPRKTGVKQSLKKVAIARTLLKSAEYVLAQWLPDGELKGLEYEARNPTRDDANAGSFKINIEI